MAKHELKAGTTSWIEYVLITDMNGSPITGLVWNSTGLLSKYVLAGAASVAITLATQTVTGAYSSGGFVEVDATAFPGLYRFDIPNAALASGNKSYVSLYGYSGMNVTRCEYDLQAVDSQDATRYGLAALPNAAAEAAGGLYTRGSSTGQINQPAAGMIDVNLVRWLGAAASTPTVAGVPNVNVKTWNDLTTVALPLVPATAGRSLVVDAAGLADANVVKIGPTGSGTAQTARDLGASVLLSSGTGTGQLDFTSGVVKANLTQILGTALTETAGQIAGAFKHLFDVAAPTLTCLDINQTGDSYARIGTAGAGLTNLGDTRIANLDAAVSTRSTYAGADTSGTTTLLTRLTSGRATNLDNLDATVSSRLAPAGTLAAVTLVSTLTTYTGNTPQTGDSFARIGAAGTGLTALGDARIAHLDADVSSRTKPADTQAAVTLVTTTTTATNLTNAPTAGDFTAAMKTSLNAATPAVTVSDKTGFSLSAAGIQAIWDALISALTTVGSVGKLLVDNINATISSRSTYAGTDTSGTTTLLTRIPGTVQPQTGDSYVRLGAAGAGLTALGDARIAHLDADISTRTKPADTQAAVTLVATTTNLTNDVGITQAGADKVWGSAARTLTSFGSLVADAAAAVWASVSRTLTAFGFTVSAAPDPNVALIKAKTDLILSTPASVSDIPTANANADALLDRTDGVETGMTLREAQRIQLSAAGGKLSGAATTLVKIRDTSDTKDRITSVVDADGNRVSVTLDAT